MTIWQRIAREPNALTGVVVALYGALVAFGVLELTIQQTGALGVLGGALVFALRWFVTPASEVVAQQRPDQPVPVAGPASTVADGVPVDVVRDDRGSAAIAPEVVILVLCGIAAAALFVIANLGR